MKNIRYICFFVVGIGVLTACGLSNRSSATQNDAEHVKQVSQSWSPDNEDGTYTNPIIHADYSDPDICRVGDDYYMTASSFNCVPGLPILHSKDLINWTLVGHALDSLIPSKRYDVPLHGKGVFAPSIRYHKPYFYIYWGDPDIGVFMVKTKDPHGKWDAPILVKEGKGFIDTCPLWDDDGRVYMVFALAGSRVRQSSMLLVNELSADGTEVIDGQGRVVYSGHGVNPTIEGPKFYKHKGYYWIFAPAGGVKNGWQLALRSTDIYGPYEVRKVLDRGSSDINGPHQGGWVTTPDGREDWFVHFQEKGAYGRIIHLQPMTWREDGWPVIGIDQDGDGVGEPVITHKKPKVGKVYPVANPQESDEFNSGELGLQWQWHANPKVYWYYPAREYGSLRLFPVPEQSKDKVYNNMLDCPNLLLQKFPAEEFSAVTKVSFNPSDRRAVGERGGLIVMGYDYAMLAFEHTADGVTLSAIECVGADRKNQENVIATISPNSLTAWLRVDVAKGGKCQFYYSTDGKNFDAFGKEFIARKGGWIGAKLGLFCMRPEKAGSGGWLEADYFRIEKLN